jgi:hypothetical protein
VPNVAGAVLTERDKALLCYVGVSRYASAEQIHRLFFDGRSKKQTYRRLAKLCTPGGRPGEAAHLRRLEFRRREGTGVPVWALTSYGWAVAEPLVPWLRPLAAVDIGARFLEHTLLLNDVLMGLVLVLRPAATAPLAVLPFRWLSEDEGALQFQRYQLHTHQRTSAVLRPDAILEIPRRQRRLFIEAETGSQSITTANPGQTGAIVSKLRRYADFFSGMAGPGRGDTWYTRAFPDDFVPRLLFLVHSLDRRERVRRAIGEQLRERQPDAYQVLVYTFAEAAGVLAPYITHDQLGAEAGTAARFVALDRRKVTQLVDGYNELANALDATRDAVRKHNATPGARQLPLPAIRMEAVRFLRDFIQREVNANEQRQSGGQAGAPGRQGQVGSHGA